MVEPRHTITLYEPHSWVLEVTYHYLGLKQSSQNRLNEKDSCSYHLTFTSPALPIFFILVGLEFSITFTTSTRTNNLQAPIATKLQGLLSPISHRNKRETQLHYVFCQAIACKYFSR